METSERPEGFPRMDAPEVKPPRRTIPGSLGCLGAFLVALVLVGLLIGHFYSMSNYSTELNVDGTYHFNGKLVQTHKVLFSDRYKLVIENAEKKRVVLPPLPSPQEKGEALFGKLPSGACLEGDITIRKGFLHDLTLRVDKQDLHFDADAGWLINPVPEPGETPPPEAEDSPEAEEEPPAE